jgi:transglutaminase-like putative cysteine protease
MAPPTPTSSAVLRARGLAILVTAACLCGPFSAAAQDKPAPTSPAPAPAATKPPDISKEGLVLDKIYTRIRMEADGTGTRQMTGRTRILADSGVKQMAVLTFTYTASNQQVEIGYVRVVKPDGTVVVTPDYNVQDMPADVTRTAPMYSDIHQKHIAVKGLGVGDILESQVTLRTLKPEVPGHFWLEYSFEKNLIVLDEQLDLDLPADKAVTVASADLQPTVTTANGRKLYHWASSNLARPDPDAPPKSVKHWKPSIQVTTFASWEQVGAWYQSLQRDPLAVTPAIQAKAAALTKGLTGDEDKIRAIFNDVALHIHYVGLEFGIGRYQPHPADDVLSNEYGDCKDKHTLLASLLKASGIEAWPVLISSSRELDPATPSPAQFDHVITLVPLSGKLLWMDSTEEIAPIGILMATLRDKQVLAIPLGKPAYLEHTPAELPFVQSARFQVDGKLSDQGQFTGHIAQSYHGDVELLLRTVFRQVPQSQWKEAMQRFSEALGFGGEVSNPQISEVEQTSKPLEFSYDYTREKFGEWDDHRIFPPMPPTGWGLMPGVKVKKPADDPEIGSPGEQVYVTSVQLPKGWTMVPGKETTLKEDWAEYHSSYSLKDGVFAAERELTITKTKIPLDQWDKYLAFRRAIYADEVQTSVLIGAHDAQDFQTRVTFAVLPQSTPGAPFGLPDELKKKFADAMNTFHDASIVLGADPPASARDLARTEEQCRQMVYEADATSSQLSPEDPHSIYWAQVLASAWTCLGWAETENKELGAAEIHLRSAWGLSQSRMSGYQLARVLEAKGNKSEAAHLFELASVTSVDTQVGGALPSHYDLDQRIADGYRRVTGKALTSTALNQGQYNGSLRAELDRETEIRPLTRTSKLTGQAMFTVVFETGKPVKAHFLHGDKGFDAMLPAVQAHAYPSILPSGSKARLLREVRVVCTPYAGCDAYILLPTSIEIQAWQTVKKDVTPSNAPDGTKTIQIELGH